jgi:hypothetical protein
LLDYFICQIVICKRNSPAGASGNHSTPFSPGRGLNSHWASQRRAAKEAGRRRAVIKGGEAVKVALASAVEEGLAVAGGCIKVPGALGGTAGPLHRGLIAELAVAGALQAGQTGMRVFVL